MWKYIKTFATAKVNMEELKKINKKKHEVKLVVLNDLVVLRDEWTMFCKTQLNYVYFLNDIITMIKCKIQLKI